MCIRPLIKKLQFKTELIKYKIYKELYDIYDEKKKL